MIDRLTRLFGRSTKDAAATHPRTAVAETGNSTRPAPDAAQQAALAAAERELDGGSPAAALGIARGEWPAALRCRALARVDDREALLDIALHDRIARVRLVAAERLSGTEDLERLRRDSSDKAVQRHARDTLKALREQEQARDQVRQQIARLLDGIAQHAARSVEPLYAAKLESLQDGWRAVAGQATAGEQERFAELAALARNAVQRHGAEIAARENAITAKKELIAACGELEATLKRLTTEDLSSSLAAVAALRSTQQTRWDEAATQTVADAPLAARFRQAQQRLDRWLAAAAELPRAGQEAATLLDAIAHDDTGQPTLDGLDERQAQLDQLRARIDWPADAAAPALIADLDQAARQLAAARRALQADVREQVTQLRKRRHALRHMIDAGQLRVAVRTHHWLQKRIAELPSREAAQETAALAALEADLAKLHAWYEFASVPKKEELCAGMEALAVPTDDIPARIAEVRTLRERWNALCAADPDADPELRTRFDRAAETAFAPCAAWYEAQHRLQDENLAQRAALCDELERQLAKRPADAAGWRALDQQERQWRARWKSLEPVRWPEARTTQERFHALLGRLHALLGEERRRNADARRTLIGRAQALLVQEPLDAALQAARGLQEEWKHAGWTDPRDDRALWQEFRSAVDAVFARREAARQAERSAREAEQAAAARKRAEEEAKREEKRAATQAARQTEIDLALAVADAEADMLAGRPVDQAALTARLDALPPRSPLAGTLRARCAQLGTTVIDAGVLAARAEKLAALTLELEILLDLPSPPEFAAARMQAKIAKLNAALRHRPAAGQDPRRALEDAWLAIGPVPALLRDPLLARFRVALAR
ncbi:MAG: DUF349 domain-containing protein [Pseudomonadota bacterium]